MQAGAAVSKMLRSSLLLTWALVIISSVCALEETADAETNLIRDKRQQSQSPQFRFQQTLPLGESILLINNRQTVRLTGSGSEFIAIPVNQTLRYQSGSVVFIDRSSGSPSTAQIPVNELTTFTNINGFNLQLFTGSAPSDFSLPDDVNGYFYYDRDGRAFFTNTLVVENQRPFPALFEPPAETLFEVRGAQPNDNLVLNIDNTGTIRDGVADSEDDRIVLTGSSATTVGERQSFEYLSNFIVLRDGSQISGTLPGINELNVLDLVQSGGGLRQRLRTFSGSAAGTFGGAGTLYTNGGAAFYTTLPGVQTEITEQIIGNQFKFSTSTSPSSAIIQSNLGPSGGSDLIELVGATTTSYPTASTIGYNGGTISVNDRGGNVLQQIGTAGNPVDLSTFFSHEVQQFSGGASGSFNVPPGGLTLSFNSDTSRAFAYPTRNTFLTNSIQQALASANPPAQASAGFSIRSDGLGGANLFGQEGGQDPRELVSLTNSQLFDLSENDIVTYSGNTVQVSRSGSPIASYDNIDAFAANGPSNSLDFSTGEAIQTYSGPGRLYADSQGRAFFTSNGNLINNVNTFLSRLPSVTPNVQSRTVNQTRVVNIETSGGETLVQVGSSTTQSVSSDQSVYYSNNELRTANSFNIPSNSRAFYDADNDRVTVSDSSGNVLFMSDAARFFAYRTPGGSTDELAVNTTLPSNGIIYTGAGGALYTTNNDINGPIENALDTIGASTATGSSPDDFSYYNGQTIQTFSGSAPNVFPGGGTIYTSGSQSFYSTDSGFNQFVPGIVSQLAPTSATYNSTTNRLLVSSNAGEMIFMYSIGSSPVFQVGAGGSFTFTDDNTIVGLTSEPITGVNEVRFFNGFETVSFTTGNVTFDGPGLFVFNPEAGVAFFTDDETTVRTILQRQENVINTFQRPSIARGSGDLTSKFREIDSAFGQSLTVYEGANIDLQCATRSSNPSADFDFFVLNEVGDYVQINETDLMDNYEIISSGDGATLRITGIPLSEEPARFGCRASNLIGQDFAATTVEVRPAVAPAIVNNFLPYTPVRERFNPSGLIVPATESFPSREVIVGGILTDPSELPPNPNLVNNLVHIGCKAEGRPKAEIVWLQDGVVINASLPQFDIFEPRQGRSVLTVNYTYLLEQGEAMLGMSANFTCNARNEAAEVRAGIIITPNQYVCTTSGTSDEPCSVTCGFGVRRQGVLCSMNGGDLVAVEFESLPSQLFSPPLELCQGDQAFCDIEGFAYNDDEDDFGPCSVTCGCGVERRNISCFATINGVLTNETVDDRFCEELNLKRPDETRVCTLDDCPIWVINGTFGPCSSTCRGGIRERQVDCYQNFTDFSSETNFTFGIVDDTLCEILTMPARVLECNRLIPCPFRWDVSEWQECTNNCQDRNITCINFEPTDPDERWPVNDSFCAELRRPHSVRSCDSGVCSRGDWLAGPFTECSVECGFGTYSRNVFCTERGTADTVVIEDGNCDPRFRPAEKSRCIVRNCPGRCDFEPRYCKQMASLLLCKVARFRELAEPCCMSCPAQATPIPLLVRSRATPPTVTQTPTEALATEAPMGTMATPP